MSAANAEQMQSQNVNDEDQRIENAYNELTNHGTLAVSGTREYNRYLDMIEQSERNQVYDKNDQLYPNLNDPNFNAKIAERKEFYDTRFEVDHEADIEEQAEILCNSPFELAPNQLFVRNFLSFETPYNSLLLYHGLGTGKTCSAISVAEETRDYMKQMGISQRIIMVASPNVQENFRLQLFDERKLKEIEPGVWNIRSCTGNKYLREINPMNMRGLSRDKVVKQITRLINASYLFMGYIEFANYVRNVANSGLDLDDDAPAAPAKSTTATTATTITTTKWSNEDDRRLIALVKEFGISGHWDKIAVNFSGRTGKQCKEHYKSLLGENLSIPKIKKHFSNRLLIIDEVHNIRITDDNKDKRVAKMLFQIVQHADNLKLLLLSGTPMYNSYKEIVWLLNLMNLNDGRSTIDVRQVFDKDGNLLIGADGQSIGADLLIRKATGYVSFVRGENPYTFPYRIYPALFSPENTFQNREYPRIQLNGRHIDQPIEHINTYLVNIGEMQRKGYRMIMDQLAPGVNTAYTRNPEAEEDDDAKNAILSFENMDTVGYTMIQRPLEALNIVYPHPSLFSEEEGDDKRKTKTSIANLVGKEGLRSVMKFTERANPPLRHEFEYKSEHLKQMNGERMFSPEHIGKYSAKIKNICDCIINSTGIVLVYSQFIDGGVVPMALALEELGFTRYSKTGNSLFKKSPAAERLDAVTFLGRSEHVKRYPTQPFKPAQYSMITGDPAISPENAYELKALTDEDNKYGERVKVVIISIAGAEGLDFKNLRQVHIMEPWYNMNLIEQVIGRAIRNCSHKQLPYAQRNVQIFLYGTLLPPAPGEEEREEEAVDLYLYRLSESKAVKIGVVSRLLRETAVDCILNIENNAVTEQQLNRVVRQKLSNNRVIDYRIGAKPYSSLCDYMERCDYVCKPSLADDHLKEEDVRLDTFNERFLSMNTDKIIQKLRDLYKERFFYKKMGANGLIAHLNSVRTYPLAQINMALSQLVDDANEYITDKYGRVGHLVNVGDYYLFQPIEINDKHASVYERSVPLNFKHESVIYPLGEQVTNDYSHVEQGSQIISQTTSTPADHPPPRDVADVHALNVIQKIKETYAIATSIIEKPAKTQEEWYYYTGKVMRTLTENPLYNVTIQDLHRLIIENMIEHLNYIDHMSILNYMLVEDRILDEVENMIKMYYELQMLRRKVVGRRAKSGVLSEDRALLIYRPLNAKGLQLVVMRHGETVWRDAEPEDERDFSKLMAERQESLIGALSAVVGFVAVFKKEFFVFKVKNMLNKRDKGARCDQSGKGDTISLINQALTFNPKTNVDEMKLTTLNTKERTQKELCVFQEFMLRSFNAHRENGRVWFMSPTDAILCQIEKVHTDE